MENADRNRKRMWKDEQRQLAKKAFPLDDKALEQLFAAVDVSLEKGGCDHTLRFTLQWLSQREQDAEPTLTWLRAQGGFCDCEVIANAYDHWEQNRDQNETS